MAIPVVRTLRCGTPLIVEVMPAVRSAAITFLVPAGIATEPEDLSGLANVWAELLMRGSEELTSRQQADAFDRLGVQRDTGAGAYHVRVSATMLGERLIEALPLLVDMIRRPRMDGEGLEAARALALQSLASLRDDPQERAAIAAAMRHFPPPLNRHPRGTEAGLKAITRPRAVAEWQARARPLGTIIAVAGAFDPDAVERRLNDLLADWSGTGPDPRPVGQPPRTHAHETDQTSQVQIVALFDAPPERDPDRVLVRLAVAVLSGMSGRLFVELRERRGLCYAVSAAYAGGRDVGSVQAYVGTTPPRAQESLNLLLEVLAHLGTPAGAVSDDEFHRARIGLKSRLVFAGESTAARAAALAGDFHRLGRARALADLVAEVEQATLDRLNHYLRHRWGRGDPTVQTLGPAPLAVERPGGMPAFRA